MTIKFNSKCCIEVYLLLTVELLGKPNVSSFIQQVCNHSTLENFALAGLPVFPFYLSIKGVLQCYFSHSLCFLCANYKCAI